MKPQTKIVLKHLKKTGEITPRIALFKYDILALAQRIAELRQMGHTIETEHDKVINKHTGQLARRAKYKLIKLKK